MPKRVIYAFGVALIVGLTISVTVLSALENSRSQIVELSVWQNTDDPSIIYVNARVDGGSWVGAKRVEFEGALSQYRFGSLALEVPVPSPAPEPSPEEACDLDSTSEPDEPSEPGESCPPDDASLEDQSDTPTPTSTTPTATEEACDPDSTSEPDEPGEPGEPGESC
ncbi:MAG: hypothetical protein OXS47_04575 [Chloroflexota bacterium]|nr:hypothetical protein [Chloroflexota bacterium]